MLVSSSMRGAVLAAAISFLASCAADQNTAALEARTSKAEASAPANGGRHAGYYYPPLQSSEVYKARAETASGVGRVTRLGFVTGITKQQIESNYSPRFALFAKGDDAQKMIIVGLDGETVRTLFRARALLAQLTAQARLSPLFGQMGVQEHYTFFDLAKLLGFEIITISDGATWAHRIELE